MNKELGRLPDPGEDFDGCIAALVAQAKAEFESIPEAERNRHYMRKACEAMISALDMDRPMSFLLSMYAKRIIRNAERLEAEIPEDERWTEPTDDE